MARVVVLYKTPKDAAAFDRHYADKHIPLAKKIPGLRKYEISKGPVNSPSGPSGVHLVAILHFDDMAAVQSAFASPEGMAAGGDVPTFASGGADIWHFDTVIERVSHQLIERIRNLLDHALVQLGAFANSEQARLLAELAGQEHVATTLTNALASGRVSHAYLFAGPRGTGKTSTGRLLGKALNCRNRVNGEACNECESCTDYLSGRAMEVEAARSVDGNVAVQIQRVGAVLIHAAIGMRVAAHELAGEALQLREEGGVEEFGAGGHGVSGPPTLSTSFPRRRESSFYRFF